MNVTDYNFKLLNILNEYLRSFDTKPTTIPVFFINNMIALAS